MSRVTTYRAAYSNVTLTLCSGCAGTIRPLGYALGPVLHGEHDGECAGCRARQLARRLILDDISRADDVPVERDGATAAAGWVSAAARSGDAHTSEAIEDIGGDDALAWAWDVEMTELDAVG